jgi:hypothetical protein
VQLGIPREQRAGIRRGSQVDNQQVFLTRAGSSLVRLVDIQPRSDTPPMAGTQPMLDTPEARLDTPEVKRDRPKATNQAPFPESHRTAAADKQKVVLR